MHKQTGMVLLITLIFISVMMLLVIQGLESSQLMFKEIRLLKTQRRLELFAQETLEKIENEHPNPTGIRENDVAKADYSIEFLDKQFLITLKARDKQTGMQIVLQSDGKFWREIE